MADARQTISLLDMLSVKIQCKFLSDLHYLHDWEREQLIRELEKIPPDIASIKEWNDALAYLAKAPPQQTREEARERLMIALSQPLY